MNPGLLPHAFSGNPGELRLGPAAGLGAAGVLWCFVKTVFAKVSSSGSGEKLRHYACSQATGCFESTGSAMESRGTPVQIRRIGQQRQVGSQPARLVFDQRLRMTIVSVHLEHSDLFRISHFDIRVFSVLSVHYCNGLNLDHHFRTGEFFDADERASRVAAFLEKFFS